MPQHLPKEISNHHSRHNIFAERVADKVPALIAVYNVHSGKYVYVNDCVEKMLGYSSDDILNGGFEFILSKMHPDDLNVMVEKTTNAIHQIDLNTLGKDSDPIITFEYRMRHKDGSWRWLHIDGSVFDRDAAGRVNHVMNISLDITEQKKNEEVRLAQLRLERSKDDLELIFNSIVDGVTVLDRSGNIVYANETSITFTGFKSLRELAGLTLKDGLRNLDMFTATGEPFDITDLPCLRVVKGLAAEEKIVRCVNKITGDNKWWSFRARSTMDISGQLVYVVSVIHDVTERKKIMDDLNRTHRRNEHILESIADGFFAFDKEWHFNYINKQAESFLGKRREDLIGKLLWDVFPQAKSDTSTMKIMEAVKDNRSLRFEVRSGAQNALFELSVYPSADGVSIYLRDVTETHRMQGQNAQLASIVQYSEDAMISTDLKAVIISWNRGAENIYGYSAEEVIGKNLNLIVPKDRPNEIWNILEKIKQGESVDHLETIRVRKDGIHIPVQVTFSPLRNSEDEVVCLSIVARDMTQLKNAQLKIVQSERRFRALIENSTDGIGLIEKDGKISYLSESASKILGFEAADLVGKNGAEFIHPEDIDYVQQAFGRIMEDPGTKATAVYRTKTKKGNYIWAEVVVNNLLHDESIASLVVNFRDVTERKKAEEQLQYQYHHDVLTDLPNRISFTERLTMALSERPDHSQILGVMLLDIDRFKVINESLGHSIGDRLIQEVSLRLISALGEDSLLARFGGDEFAVFIPGLNAEEDIAKLAHKILESFQPPFLLDSHELYISPSLGVSICPYDGKEVSVLLRNAEAALYRAKDQGGNSYQFYTTTMNALSYEKLTMESKMRHAIENNEFVLFYQPQVDIKTGRIIGTEEFIRWQRPDTSLMLPDRFIPLAEASGLIVPIGQWVVESSISQLKEWHDKGHKDLRMAINISGRQLREKSFIHFMLNAIDKYKIDPSKLELELTESVLIQNADNALAMMKQLNEMGVRFALDDFSTGYTSLKYLKQFPVDMLKIERVFIRDTPFDTQNVAISKSIITLGQSLGMEVVAEGVESKDQLAFLYQQGCDRAQGYLFNGAMPPQSFSEVLTEDRYTAVIEKLKK